MSRTSELATLLGNKQLPMISNRRRGGNGVSYTERELKCAVFATRIVCTAAQSDLMEKVTDQEIDADEDLELMYDLFVVLSEEGFKDIKSAIRRLYKVFEDQMLQDDDTLDDFPVQDGHGYRQNRSQSSITVMFRAALREYVSEEVLDQLFKLYSSKKNKSS